MAYRGMYPERINQISGARGVNGLVVTLNNGLMFVIRPQQRTLLDAPKLGKNISIYQQDDRYFVESYQPKV